MEKLIIIEGKEKYQFNDMQSLTKKIINEDFYSLSSKEKINIMSKKAFANCMLCKMPIKILENKQEYSNNCKNAFIIYDEITYILSLLKIGNIVLLENIDSNIFTKGIDKKGIKENYIIVNSYVDEILSKYLK